MPSTLAGDLGRLANRGLRAGPDVVDGAGLGVDGLGGEEVGVDDVAHPDEVACRLRVDERRKPAVQPLDGEGGYQALGLLPWAVRRVQPQRADVEPVRRGDVTAEHRGRGLGDRVRAVRLDGVVLGRRAALEAVLRARAGVDERLDVRLTGRLEQVGGADDVRAEDRRAIRLPGVGAVGGEVQDPLGARGRDGRRDRVAVRKVELDDGSVSLDLGEAPAIGARPRQERRLVRRRRAGAARRSRR